MCRPAYPDIGAWWVWRQGPFFANFGAICVYAFLGTFLSTVVVGALTYGFGAIGATYALSLKESLVFGSLVSATGELTSMHAPVWSVRGKGRGERGVN